MSKTGNLFESEDSDVSGFEIEGNEPLLSNKEITKPIENKLNKVKVVENTPITNEDSKVVDVLSEYNSKSKELLVKVGKIVSIINDDDNSNARKIGKEIKDTISEIKKSTKKLNEPFEQTIAANKKRAEDIIAPIEKHINRLNILISSYETQKENKRKEELRKLELEKLKKQQEEIAKQQRINKIKSNLDEMKEKVRQALSSDDINYVIDFKNKINSFNPKQEFYQEFYDEIIQIKEQFLKDVEVKIPLLKDIIKNKEEAEKLQGLEKAQKLKEAEIMERELALEKERKALEESKKIDEQQEKENEALQHLLLLATTLEIENPADFIERQIEIYGDAKTALLNKEEIENKFNEEQNLYLKKKELDSEKVKNQRKNYIFKIVDENKVPREFLSVDESKIRKAITENRNLLEKDITSFSINGVHISVETKTIFAK